MIITDEKLLLQPSAIVDKNEAIELILALERALEGSQDHGIGLAACQIGILKRAFIIRISPKLKYDFINPQISALSNPVIFTKEGCLSYPGQQIRTLRYNNVTITDDLHPDGLSLSGLPAIVAQHEYQHTIGQNMFRNQLSNVSDGELCPCGSNIAFKSCCKITLRKNMRII